MEEARCRGCQLQQLFMTPPSSQSGSRENTGISQPQLRVLVAIFLAAQYQLRGFLARSDEKNTLTILHSFLAQAACQGSGPALKPILTKFLQA